MLLKEAILLGLGAMLLAPANGRAYRYRQKRPSDQRLEELASFVALSKPEAQFKMDVPVGLGMDPVEYGRRRRSSEALLQDLLERRERERESEREEEAGSKIGRGGGGEEDDSLAQPPHWFIDAV